MSAPRNIKALPAVLAVDDVDANLAALRALLEDLPCEVVCARSGSDALHLLRERIFAVLLLDVQMPEMDGYEVATRVRSNGAGRDVPIIFLTASPNSRDNVHRGYGSGAVDFLFKPVDPHVLLGKVTVFLELYSARREVSEANAALERKNTALQATAEELRKTNASLTSAYRELQDAQSQLVHSAKMASLGQLVAGVAHEINNPLAFATSHLATVQACLGVVGDEVAASLSETGGQSWSRACSRLEGMELGLSRIRDLVVKLRTFSRKDEGLLKTVSVRESIEAVLTILGHQLHDQISVEADFGEPDRLECYPSLLNQALLNLIANSIDAIDDVGRIEIRTGRRADEYFIEVVDTGHGIPDDIRDRVFEPFFTTKSVGRGTGLGLSITHAIVEQHGGTLELNSAVGGGTAATIRIPLGRLERTLGE